MKDVWESIDLKEYIKQRNIPEKLLFNSKGLKSFFKENVNHFKKDKWALNLNYLVEDLFWHIFGCNASDFIIKNLLDNGIKAKLCLKNNDLSIGIIESKKKKLNKKTAIKKKAKKKK